MRKMSILHIYLTALLILDNVSLIENSCVFHTASTLDLGLQSGILLAVPIPEEHAATGQQIEDAIQTALSEAK